MFLIIFWLKINKKNNCSFLKLEGLGPLCIFLTFSVQIYIN